MSFANTSPAVSNDSGLERLKSLIAGAVIAPWDAQYDQARRAWNLSIDQYPAVIVAARSPDDIAEALRYARAAGLAVAVQSTGHGIARKADGAMLLVTSPMNEVRVEAKSQVAWVEAGAVWQQVLDKAQAVGLAPLLGSSLELGVMGYTLGGGMGWLARKYGLAADSVTRFNVITADGRMLTASHTENSDLFWGLRGGGGILAVVTSMEIQLYPVASVFGGNLIYPVEMAKEVFAHYREWTAHVPDELTSSIVLMNFPPFPHVPEFLRGKSAVMVRGCYCGRAEEGQTLLQHWLSWRAPIANQWHSMPFSQVGSISNDPRDPMPNFHTGAWIRELSDEAIDILIQRTFAQPQQDMSPLRFAEVRHAGGAISRVDESDSPIGHRDGRFALSMVGLSPTPESYQAGVAYTAIVKSELRPWLKEDGVFLNFLEGEEARARTEDGYSASSYQRLVTLKSKYDPHNLFSHSFDLQPSMRPNPEGDMDHG